MAEKITASLTVSDETITAELNTAARGPEGPAGSGGGGGGGGDLLAANNLSDVASAGTSRTNLGVDPAGTDNSDNNATNSSSTPIAHASDTANPHTVTKAQVGLGSVDNTSDANAPVSTAQAAADAVVLAAAVQRANHTGTQTLATISDAGTAAASATGDFTPIAHATDTANPHTVTKTQVGLGNVDNTSDANAPVSTAQASADAVVLAAAIQRSNHTGTQTLATISDAGTAAASATGDFTPISHATDTANPHSVTATQVGLGNVDNTSDANAPVSTAQAAADAVVLAAVPVEVNAMTTITGAKTFSGQVEHTGQAATTDDSAMTRGLSDTRYKEHLAVLATSDLDRSSDDTVSADDELVLALTAGKWRVRGDLYVSESVVTNTSGAKARVNITASYTGGLYSLSTFKTSAATLQETAKMPAINITATMPTETQGASLSRLFFEFAGIIEMSGAGSIQWEWAQNTSNANAARRYKYSNLEASRIG
jgi:hypothetical protein